MTPTTLAAPAIYTVRGKRLHPSAALVLRVVEAWPGSTGDEIHARLPGWRRFEVSIWLLHLLHERVVRKVVEGGRRATWEAR